MQRSALSDRSYWLLAWLASVFALLLPALYNGFPLIFPDTPAYLKVAYGDFWTLDRSGFYGLLFKPIVTPTGGLLGLWLAIVLQSAIVAGVLIMAARSIAPMADPLCVLGVIALTCLVTSLPWHAAQLMPDAFTGPLVLTAWLAASRDADAEGTPLLWLATVFLGLMHYTYLGLIAVVASVALLFAAAARVEAKEIAKRAVLALVAVAMIVAAHVSVNGLYLNRWAVSPMGSWFLFARLNEDGLVPVWLEDHCGRDAPEELCAIRGTLPRDSQLLLWSTSSPLHRHIHARMGSAEHWHWVDMLGAAASGSIREHPVEFLAAATRNTARQLVRFNAVDDQCPEICRNLGIREFRPEVGPAIDSSRQLRGDIPKPLIRAVTNAAQGAGLILLLPMFVLAIRRRDRLAQSLIATVAMCVLANAFLGAALSAVNDRYQSRIVWIVPFAELLLLLRWRAAKCGGQSSQ